MLTSKNKKGSIPLELLRGLFNSEPWVSRDERFKNNPSFYWGPLIALYHGCRRGEVASLLETDVIEEDGIAAFSFSWIVSEQGKLIRRYKNTNSERKVPIHPELLKMGFMRFVEEQRQVGERQLFPEHKANIHDKWGYKLSSWFNKHLRSLSPVPTKCTFHSFRHCFEDALKPVELYKTSVGYALGGRSDTDNVSSADNYGDGYSVKDLLPEIKKVKYEGLDLSHLYVDTE